MVRYLMNAPVLRNCLFYISGFFLSHLPLSAQEITGFQPDSADFGTYVLSAYGPDQVLANGLYPEDYILDATGHPFFMDTAFHPGYVVLHSHKYDHVSLQYNIFDQNIIVSRPGFEGGGVQIIPPNAFVSEFKMDDKVFRKFCFDGTNENYYQVVYDGEIKCLSYFTKKRYIAYNRSKYSTFTFSKDIRKNYLLMDKKPYEFKNSGSFLRCFPKSVIPGIKAYCEKEKLRFSRASDAEIGKLMKFCENEMRGN